MSLRAVDIVGRQLQREKTVWGRTLSPLALKDPSSREGGSLGYVTDPGNTCKETWPLSLHRWGRAVVPILAALHYSLRSVSQSRTLFLDWPCNWVTTALLMKVVRIAKKKKSQRHIL